MHYPKLPSIYSPRLFRKSLNGWAWEPSDNEMRRMALLLPPRPTIAR
jgi:hypothetical protein